MNLFKLADGLKAAKVWQILSQLVYVKAPERRYGIHRYVARSPDRVASA
jgi:hypothetical protein